MTASLAATIRRHVEEMEPKPEVVVVHPDDWSTVYDGLDSMNFVVWLATDDALPRGCYVLRDWKDAG